MTLEIRSIPLVGLVLLGACSGEVNDFSEGDQALAFEDSASDIETVTVNDTFADDVSALNDLPNIVYTETLPDSGLEVAYTVGLQRDWIDPLFVESCLLYTSPSPRDGLLSRMPSSA